MIEVYKSMSIEDLTLLCTQKYSEKTILESDIKKIVPILFAKMEEKKLGEVKSPFGRYYTSHSTKYTYSEATQKMKDELDIAQEREKAEGIATKKETANIKFGKLNKDDNEFNF